jgi:hypothetical protein
MFRKLIDKETAKQIIVDCDDKQNILVYSDSYWDYPLDLPTSLRDAKNSIMLDLMIEIEKHAGTLIYIPNKEIKNAG